jgi:ABC-type Fe3+/spermidine/putrescine transport system ATPase subunit
VVALFALAQRQRVVGEHAGTDRPRAAAPAVVDRDEERERVHEVGGDRQQPLALAQRLADKSDLQVLEVAQTAVDQPGRAASRAGCHVGLVDERDSQPA